MGTTPMEPARQDTPLKRLLRSEGRRQSWLAEQVGVSQVEMSRWTNGIHIPVVATRQRIADVLGREVEDLWPTGEDVQEQAA